MLLGLHLSMNPHSRGNCDSYLLDDELCVSCAVLVTAHYCAKTSHQHMGLS